MQNYTAVDLVQTVAAALALALFLLPPGYLLGMASNIFAFRRRSIAEKLLFSVAYSVAVTPILAALGCRLLGYGGALAVFLVLTLAAMVLLVLELRRPATRPTALDRHAWRLLGMAAAWFLVVALSTADLQMDHRLYLSHLVYDHSIRVPLVEAAARSVPPLNPFYGVGEVPLLRYFYYWYVVCALPMHMFGLSARHCLDASAFWSAFALAALIPLFLKHFCGMTEALRRRSVIGVALLAVTGLDLLPYGLICALNRSFIPDMEWWDSNQVASWTGSFLWVPHHVAALTACMAGLLVISTLDEQTGLRRAVAAAAIAGVAFASAAGLSLLVSFCFALAAMAWGATMAWQRQWRTVAWYALAGGIATALSWPFLADMLFGRRGAAGAAAPALAGARQFASFAVRDLYFADLLFRRLGWENPLLLALASLLVLAGVYCIEFGFYGIVVFILWRQERGRSAPLPRWRRMLWTIFIVGLLAMSFIRSSATGLNDLGFRGMLVVQFVLLLWAVPVASELYSAAGNGHGSRWIRWALKATLLLGVAASLWQVIALRTYLPLAAAGRIDRAERFLGSPGYPERAYWLRRGWEEIGRRTPAAAVVQYNPVRDEVMTTQFYSNRQAVAGDAYCNATFGGDATPCRAAFPEIAATFNDPELMRSRSIDDFCAKFSISALLATDADPVWGDGSSWVWKRPSLFASPSVRVIPCGAPSAPPLSE